MLTRPAAVSTLLFANVKHARANACRQRNVIIRLTSLQSLDRKLFRKYIYQVGSSWRSGESAHLQPMWPGFESRTTASNPSVLCGLSLLLVELFNVTFYVFIYFSDVRRIELHQ